VSGEQSYHYVHIVCVNARVQLNIQSILAVIERDQRAIQRQRQISIKVLWYA